MTACTCVDLRQLTEFLVATQPETASALSLDAETPTRRQFLNRLKEQIGARGIIDVLRNGVGHQQHQGQPLLRHPDPGQRPGRGQVPAEPILGDQAAALLQRRQAEVARHRPVHQWPPHSHHGAEEQVHRPDRRRRGNPVPDGPQPQGRPAPARPLRRPLRGGRRRG